MSVHAHRTSRQGKPRKKKHTPEEEVGKYHSSSVTPVSQPKCLALVRGRRTQYHGGQNDYLNNSKVILICNRTNAKLSGKLNSLRVGNGNFENSKLFEGLVILKKKTQDKSKRKKKRCIASSDLFSPPLDVPLMLMTDFLQRTALNQCRWCGMEDNRCGRHVLGHWRELCVGDGRSGRHVLDQGNRRS